MSKVKMPKNKSTYSHQFPYQNDINNPNQYLSPKEVSNVFNVSVRTVYNWIRENKIPGFKKIGGSWRIKRSKLPE